MARPEIVAELLSGPYPLCLATAGKDGAPYSVVIWCGPEEGNVTVNGAESRWLRNLRRDPRVSFLVVDTRNILRHVAAQGTVVSIEPDEGYAHINSLAQVYEGRDYVYESPQEVPRFKVVIEPGEFRTLDISPADY